MSHFDKLEKQTAAVHLSPPKKAHQSPLADNMKKVKRVMPGKPAKSVIGPRQKFVNSIVSITGKELPTIEKLFNGMGGHKMRIRDIAVFISDTPGKGEKGGSILTELAQEIPHRNTINLSAEVSLAQTKNVGIGYLEAGVAWMPIVVTRLTDGSKAAECMSGRHRLAFLALAYGPNTEVPVDIRADTTQKARDGVIYANQSRRILVMEGVEHSVFRATGGKKMDEVDREELYKNMAVNKQTIIDFCVKSTEMVKSMKLDFVVNDNRIKRGGQVMSNAVVKFFSNAIEWNKDSTRVQIDKKMRDAVSFINVIYAHVSKQPTFNIKLQFSVRAMGAVGKLIPTLTIAAAGSEEGLLEYAPIVAQKLLEMGKNATMPVEQVYGELKSHIEKMRKAEVKK